MRIPTIECENCHSNSVRLARYNGLGERVRAFFGIQPFRCRDCKHRFTVSIWLFDKLIYAKCPKCLRMDLVFWAKKNYKPSALTNFFLSLGARRYRCSSCRCNFVSFRPRRGVKGEESAPKMPLEAAPAPAVETTPTQNSGESHFESQDSAAPVTSSESTHAAESAITVESAKSAG